MEKIVLYQGKDDCCGCGACMNACPRDAITMKEDEDGFLFPNIDNDLCVGCGVCKRACGYQTIPERNSSSIVYAAAAKEEKMLQSSASGGVFGTVAAYILEQGGVVYGAALPYEDGQLNPKHIRIDRKDQLTLLQGSKYVQSEIGYSFRNVRRDLNEKKIVLFSGTPCQIAGLKKYLNREYENLYVMDIICHGVPSSKLFHNFMRYYEKKLGGSVREFYFRDKSRGQGMVTRFVYDLPSGEVRETVKAGGLMAYFQFFLRSYTYRLNCYSCPFASAERVGDITAGDYWGFHEEYPEMERKKELSNDRGISCALINTRKGADLIQRVNDRFVLMESSFEKVDRHNAQLHMPSRLCPERAVVLELFRRYGYKDVEKYYRRHYPKDLMRAKLSDLLPKKVKKNIKRIIGTVFRIKM